MAKTTEHSDFQSWQAKNIKRIDMFLAKALEKHAQNQPPEVVRLFEAMSYGVLGGGKRLRPLLTLAAAEAVGGRTREALQMAAAVEIIHAYSLIHDDLPAMDNDDLRRGRPTCHKVYGEGLAILAGDGLLTLAFEILADCGCKSLEAARRINQAAVYLARAAGALGMVGGQAMDLAFEGKAGVTDRPITGDMVREMESRKTAAIFTVALVCGAILGGGGPASVKTMQQIGKNAGLAFQIKDDLLNLYGDPTVLGKAVGSDAARGKASFPAITGAAEAERELKMLTEKALAAAASFRLRGRHLVFLIGGMVNRQM